MAALLPDVKEEVTAVFSWILFQSEDHSFAIAKYRRDDGTEFVAKGNDLPLEKNLMVRMYGSWKLDKSGRNQFQMDFYEIARQNDRAGVVAYLQALRCGIGKAKANWIFDKYGQDTWDILRDNPYDLMTVKGISTTQVNKLIDAMGKTQGLRGVIMLFTKANVKVSPSQASRFCAEHKDPVADLKENPYCAVKTEGITFEKADALAYSLGFPPDDPERQKAYIGKLLADAASKGHVCLPADVLLEQMANGLDLCTEICRKTLFAAYEDGAIRATNGLVYSKHSYEEEASIARCVKKLLLRVPLTPAGIDRMIEQCETAEFRLSESQKKAVKAAFASRLSIITGGPGTGKTTVIKTVLAVHQLLFGEDSNPILLAPTGRSARRMSNATGFAAQTIHSAVGYRGMDVSTVKTEPFSNNLIVVDECSMMDQFIACELLKRCPDNAFVVLVGDPDQLPSVGAGNVLDDLIRSTVIPVTKLDVIYRQNDQNPIVRNAHAINHGIQNLLFTDTFRFLGCYTPEDLIERAVNAYLESVKRDGLDNVVLLNPQRNNTAVSVDVFNKILQEKINPPAPGKAEMTCGKITFREGDKVMQLKNTESAKNGDVGYIRAITNKPSPEDPEISIPEAQIEFNDDGKLLSYGTEEMGQVDLAYCTTVHKSQGEEYQTVIMVISKNHRAMLRRNLIYTGTTRSRQNVCYVGEPDALSLAIGNCRSEQRFSNLANRLYAAAKK